MNYCQKRVFSGRRDDMRGHLCGKPAKTQENGAWLCSIHTAAAEAKRNAERNARWDAEAEARRQAPAQAQERDRRASLFPELVEALKAHLVYCETGTEVDFNHFAHLRDKALRKAEGK